MKSYSFRFVSVLSLAFLAFAAFGACEIIGEYGLRNTFKDKWSIQGVEFQSLVEIRNHGLDGSFDGCYNIGHLNFNRVTNVLESGCEGAFRRCSAVANPGFSDLVHAGRRSFAGAFANCDSLNELTMNNLEDAGEEAFAGSFVDCHLLENVRFEKLREIGEDAFSGAFRSLFYDYDTVLTFPVLGDVSAGAFSDNNRLSEIYLPSATNVGELAFANCENLDFVIFSGATNVATLADKNAFSNISSLASIVVPAELYTEWVAASNWCDVADMIVSDGGYGTNCDFYVSARIGNDNFDGLTPSTAKRTIDAAIALATNNQVIGVMDGHYAYPEFFAANDTKGSAYPVTIRGLSNNVYIDKHNNAGYGYITGCTQTWTAFENIHFRNFNKRSGTGKWGFLYTYLYNCTFDDCSVTQRVYRGVWTVSVLERCKIRNVTVSGSGGYGDSFKDLNPVVFCDCIVYDSEIELNTVNANPGPADLSLSNITHFDNAFVKGGDYYSLEIYEYLESKNFGEKVEYIDSTVLPHSAQKPNGWGDHMIPITLTNCLAGVDAMDLNPSNHVHSIVTGYDEMNDAIDPDTKKPNGSHRDWRTYGYKGIPVMLNKAYVKRRFDIKDDTVSAPEDEVEREDSK